MPVQYFIFIYFHNNAAQYFTDIRFQIFTSLQKRLDHNYVVGVDLVLNSLSEEKLQASIRVISEHGRFLEIGKFDLSKNTPLGRNSYS